MSNIMEAGRGTNNVYDKRNVFFVMRVGEEIYNKSSLSDRIDQVT
jgi:hypothetical protein